jgi:hypothetical protein
MNPHRDRAESIVPWIAGALFALPVLIAKYPPMADLPLHEASVGLWHHWGDARFAPPTVYFLNLGQANQLFSFLVFALAYVFPIAWASKLIVAGCLFALPLAAAHFSTYLGASRWPALLVAPLGLGWLFFWGLVQNILGLAALLWLLPVIDRFASRPTAKKLLATCAGMISAALCSPGNADRRVCGSYHVQRRNHDATQGHCPACFVACLLCGPGRPSAEPTLRGSKGRAAFPRHPIDSRRCCTSWRRFRASFLGGTTFTFETS